MNKIYEKQSYVNHTATKVTACKEENNRFFIQMEDTIFFPEEGGQYADTGVIIFGNDQYDLIDGQIKDGEIWYEVPVEMPEGSEVICRLNWQTRYMRMQQHSGEHLMTAVIHNRYGFDNVGFHLSDDAPVTLVMNGVLSREQVLEMERIANDVIYRNLPIIDTYPTKEELEHINYRSKKEIEGQVRLITIGSRDEVIDTCACCAPHVSHTGEIGIIKVISVAAYKGGTQIGILCGKRAVDYIRKEHEMISEIARGFSTAIENIPSSIESLKSEVSAIKDQCARLMDEKIKSMVDALPEGENGCMFINDDLSSASMKNAYNLLCERFTGRVGIFVGNDEEGYRYFAGSRSIDSREIGNSLREIGAKGGGTAEMVQGKIDSVQQIITEIIMKS